MHFLTGRLRSASEREGHEEILFRIGILLFLLPIIFSCVTFTLASLTHNRDLWKSHRIRHYRYTLRNGCFCPFTDPVVIEVRNDQTVSIVDKATGKTHEGNIDFREYFEHVDTMDKVFQFIEYALKEADRVSVDYDDRFGYPVEVSILWNWGWTDSSSGYHISDFEILDENVGSNPSPAAAARLRREPVPALPKGCKPAWVCTSDDLDVESLVESQGLLQRLKPRLATAFLAGRLRKR